jgi:hypothetical protein
VVKENPGDSKRKQNRYQKHANILSDVDDGSLKRKMHQCQAVYIPPLLDGHTPELCLNAGVSETSTHRNLSHIESDG